jgi:hypothetical protein
MIVFLYRVNIASLPYNVQHGIIIASLAYSIDIAGFAEKYEHGYFSIKQFPSSGDDFDFRIA